MQEKTRLRYFYDPKGKRYFTISKDTAGQVPWITRGLQELTEKQYRAKTTKKETPKTKPNVKGDSNEKTDPEQK